MAGRHVWCLPCARCEPPRPPPPGPAGRGGGTEGPEGPEGHRKQGGSRAAAHARRPRRPAQLCCMQQRADAAAHTPLPPLDARLHAVPPLVSSRRTCLASDWRQASVAHSRQSVLPVPVGLSSSACWPCGGGGAGQQAEGCCGERRAAGTGRRSAAQRSAAAVLRSGRQPQTRPRRPSSPGCSAPHAAPPPMHASGAHVLQGLDHPAHVVQLAGVGLVGELHLHPAAVRRSDSRRAQQRGAQQAARAAPACSCAGPTKGEAQARRRAAVAVAGMQL